MRLTIRKKLVVSYAILASLVFVSGVIGVYCLHRLASAADTVAKEKAPVQYALMQASLAVEKTKGGMCSYINSFNGLQEKVTELQTHLDDFTLWAQAIQLGTGSEEFRQTPSGSRFSAMGLSLVIPRVSGPFQDQVTDLLKNNDEFQAHCRDLIEAHQQYAAYSVETGEKSYPLPVFLTIIHRGYLEWVKRLKDAVEIVTLFTGETDPDKDLMGQWLTSYRTGLEDLDKTIEKLQSNYRALMALAVAINQETSYEKKLALFNRGIGSTARIESSFRQLQEISQPLYQDMEARKGFSYAAVSQSAARLNQALATLVHQAEAQMQTALEESDSTQVKGFAGLSALTVFAMIFAGIVGLKVSGFMSRAILEIAVVTRNVARGDLRKIAGNSSDDELGDLSRDTNTMIGNLKEIIQRLQSFSEDLTVSSGDLSSLSEGMSKDTREMTTSSETVSGSAGTLSRFMGSVAAACQQAAVNVDSVTQAANGITASVAEMAKNASEGCTATQEAVRRTDEAKQRIDHLGRAAQEISKVTEIISEISEQINLLALNATIEAARAGQAGRGFAVVASEIKDLAKQTSTASQGIRSRVEGIQASTSKTVDDISDISGVIARVNSMVSSMAQGVEEQSQATLEIAENMRQASKGLREVNENVARSAGLSDGIAEDIRKVNLTSQDVQENNSRVSQRASGLAELSTEIGNLIGRFVL